MTESVWSAGARSIGTLSGDSYATFDVGAFGEGVLVGLTTFAGTPEINTIDFGLLIRETSSGVSVRVIENGVFQTPEQSFQDSYPYPQFRIYRVQGEVWYKVLYKDVFVQAWTYESGASSVNGPLYLAAMIGSKGAFVENPLFKAALSLSLQQALYPRATIEPKIRQQVGVRTLIQPSLGSKNTVYGLSQALNVEEVLVPSSISRTLTATFTSQVGVSESITFAGEQIESHIPALEMIATDYAYAFIKTSLPAIRTVSYEGLGQQPIPLVFGTIPPLVMSASAWSGVIISWDSDLPALALLAGDYEPYIEVDGSLPALFMYADDWPAAPNYYGFASDLYLVAPMVPDAPIVVNIQDGLEAGTTLDFVTLFQESLMDGLMLDTTLTLTQIVQQLIESGLLLASSSVRDPRIQTQYAVNTMTSAVSRYENFDFNSIVQVNGRTYATREDGLYEITDGDDAGTPIDALVDFGMKGFDSSELKRLDDVYMGLDTDGEVYLRVQDDKQDWVTYQVEQRDPTSRARVGRGMIARRWNVQLHVVDATELELDNIEFFLAYSLRRSR